MYKIKTTKTMDSVTASRMFGKARNIVKGWVFIKPTTDGYVIVHIQK